ncbi:alpha/beta hydrolase [Gordonia alkaliphila]|uniref:alpha/beta hydrolase n=1 Tax=Gordonia alkaliphila TaxID=1053547 RepID=UPI001FF2B2A4|nr:alpha/beta hydrolase [Gordonia alkaliphila]MCK0438494.1 alpha/beta hydrolase [Gordonia alkaliphila]
MSRRSVDFVSGGTRCAAWSFSAAADSPFAGDDGAVPVVVMAHGFGGTKDSGLEPFAERLAAAGLAVFAFDYRHYGDSDGEPRQHISLTGQADDYRAAMAAAAAQPGVDRSRVILWGVSLAGGLVLEVASGRDDLAAVIAMVPLVSGLAAGIHHYPQLGVAGVAKSTSRAVGSALKSRLGRAPSMMTVVGPPGSGAALSGPGYLENYLAVAGPTWRNEVDAAIGLELGSFRADKSAHQITAPTLVQIADFDQAAPPYAAAKAAFAARAQVRHYPCDHFDIFEGFDWFEQAVTHQIDFLTHHLA